MLAIQLPKDIEDISQALADKTHRSKTYYAKEAILTYLEDMEDLAIAEQYLKDKASGNIEYTSLEDARCKLDL